MLIQLPILSTHCTIFSRMRMFTLMSSATTTQILPMPSSRFPRRCVWKRSRLTQACVDTYKNLGTLDSGNVNDVVMLVANIKADDWSNILSVLGDSGNALLPLLDTKNNIETFLTIPLVSKCGLSFPSVIVPIVAGVTTFLQSKVMTSLMNTTANAENDQAAAMTQSMNKMMLYFMPIMMAFFCFAGSCQVLRVFTGQSVTSSVFCSSIFLQKFYKKETG